MNLVGPRPIRPVFLATSMREIRNYAARFVVRPGMTGLAQLRGGYFTHPRDKLRYDVLYIRNRGFWLDLKLVVATFVKLLNRWLTLGLLLALIFLSRVVRAGGVPRRRSSSTSAASTSRPSRRSACCSRRSSLVRQIPAHRLYLYRTPTNRPMLCFVVFSVVAGPASRATSVPRLRDVAYFTASGFLLFFLVVSGDMTAGFARRATRVVALAAVAVALLGILQVVLADATAAAAPRRGLPRLASTLGQPGRAGGVPRARHAARPASSWCARERREERDFWLICTTLVLVGVLLTQTRARRCSRCGSRARSSAWRVSRRAFRLVARRRARACSASWCWSGRSGSRRRDLGAEWSRGA